MTSSIGVTKILTFYFILLYLFLKVKMCVGLVHAGKSISDSDINYYDNDESFQPDQTTVSTVLESVPTSAGLVNYSAKNNHHQHAGMMPRAHHVRHEHHYMKNRHVVDAGQSLRAYKNNFETMDSRIDNHRSHHHHKRMHHHVRKHIFRPQYHGRSRQNVNPLESSSFLVSPLSPELKRTRLNRSGTSITTSNINQNTVRGGRWSSGLQKFPSVTSSGTHSARSIKSHNSLNSHTKSSASAYSKTYFEKLLNSYKSHSPYYKDQQKDSSKLIKSLPNTNRTCNSRTCKQTQARAESSDEYEYEDDDADEDDYDSSETQGDAGYSTTLSPALPQVEPTKNSRSYQHKKLNSGSNKNDNDLHHDDAIKGTSIFNGHRRDDMIESVTEGRKAQKESYGIASRLASSHAVKIRREGSCSTPKPKMILASDDPTKQYTPHCTILHRCGDDVGCCLPTQTCAPSKNSTVELYFFVQTIGSKPSIERLRFVNHTECACTNRNDSPHRRTPATSSQSPIMLTPTCTCPSLFQRVIDNNNRCFCDCSSSDAQCDQFKRGFEHFSMENRRCIKDGRCEEPVCEYGHYNKAKGKCPTRDDKLAIAFKG
ncbi:uncharacterized protein LOC129777261 isoform X2 [Toxorhynchites rutilus septentrionalis]|uniref:uncharacterized protein LOC129777261 isoform X2 n=1 Tax=Toxorhynchites rutilus septentrionalis TaxID=329112 RepID=UPI002478E564|nr:uncharacterized protein LOC129777261 isoform X2 [Toxorhynchites rutilus septentrionalis]